LRFHPGRLAELFPERIVASQGDPSMLPQARRLAAHKMTSCWQAAGRPMIPLRESLTFDLETREGPRRFYSLDTQTGKARYVDAFRTRPLAAAKPLEGKAALAAFDTVWGAFDREYAMFAIKPNVDWAKLRETYRPRAESAKDNQALAAVISEMLDHLEDLHVHVQVDGLAVPGYNRERPLNANPKGVARVMGSVTPAGRDLAWGRTDDGIGYIRIVGLVDPALPQTFDEVLQQIGDTKGLILDLRWNGGGSEPLGREIAGRFLDRPRVYSCHQLRCGPKHTDLAPKRERECVPAGPWYYTGPVAVLQGRKTMSSAESFALMLAQCPQVITLGDHTGGSSGNPRLVDAGAGIVVNLPRWIDMDPEGKPIDAVGIAPRIKIETRAEDFAGDRDPVLDTALENVRSRAKSAPAGKNLRIRKGATAPADRPKVVSVWPANQASDVDPITEIRIRFDRPMYPLSAGLFWESSRAWGRIDGTAGFQLRASPRYVPDSREFVIPAALTPGVTHCVGLKQGSSETTIAFKSAEGASAAGYSWQFVTRRRPHEGDSTRPRVVSFDPPTGSETGVLTSIRVRLDRATDPARCDLQDKTWKEMRDPMAFAPFPVEYDADAHCLTVTAFLPPGKTTRLEFGGLQNSDGDGSAPATVEYRVGHDLHSAQQLARIREARGPGKLIEIVEAVRRNRLGLKSLEATVCCVTLHRGLASRWFSQVQTNHATFVFQGDRQFLADVSSIMRTPFRVGSDGEQCWNVADKDLTVSPFDALQVKNILFCDPFGAKQYPTTAQAVEQLLLQYMGTEEQGGRSLHRIRSWNGQGDAHQAFGVLEWLIDAQTSLPVVLVEYGSVGCTRHEYAYRHVNEPVPVEMFRPPTDAGLIRRPLQPLEAGCERYFLNARDGSDGRMSVRWGQQGPKKTYSSGLN
jgi:hypothetical protein